MAQQNWTVGAIHRDALVEQLHRKSGAQFDIHNTLTGDAVSLGLLSMPFSALGSAIGVAAATGAALPVFPLVAGAALLGFAGKFAANAFARRAESKAHELASLANAIQDVPAGGDVRLVLNEHSHAFGKIEGVLSKLGARRTMESNPQEPSAKGHGPRGS